LKKQIEKISEHRDRYRGRRKRSQIPVIAIVGYTNAGKSTLLNRLSNSGIYTADQLFATLDPTTRRVVLPGNHVSLLTDTVGFIQKLPTQLIAAFRATLEEISQADLLLHLIDISHDNAHAQFESVQQTLAEINADHVPTINVFNKSDKLEDPEEAQALLAQTDPDAFLISAKTGQGIDELKIGIMEQLFEKMIPVHVRLPFKEGALIALFHEQGIVDLIENERGGVILTGALPGRLFSRFQEFIL
jgi:GTP-binding protein HflX